MKKFFPGLLAVAFAAASTASVFLGQAQNLAPAGAPSGLLATSASAAMADGDEKDRGDRGGKHRNRGEGRNGSYNNGGYNNGSNNGGSSISGCVASGVFNGNEVTLQTNNNGQVTVNEQQLLNQGRGLSQGQCVTLQGYYNGNVFNVSNGGGGYTNRGRNGNGENDNEQGNYGRGNSHGCVNPAGHQRGWCKNGRNGGYNNNGGNNGRNGNYGSCQQSISGYIILVSGSNVTINKNLLGGTVQFDASQAINNGQTNGNLSIGRHITVCGYTDGSGFHAVSIR